MRVKIRKNVLILSLIALFVVTVAPAISYATTATLEVKPLETVGYEDFYVEVAVNHVSEMFGYQFKLVYDTDVLTATGFESYHPFTKAEPSEINDPEGYVKMAYHFPYPELEGLTWDYEPWDFPVAKIYFTVDEGGSTSQLDLEATALADIHGNHITAEVTGGEFRTETGCPLADFSWTPEIPMVGEEVAFTSTSSDPDGVIVSEVWTFGDSGGDGGAMVTHAYDAEGFYTVTLTVTDNDEMTDSYSRIIQVVPTPPPGAMAIEGWTSYTGINPGKSTKVKVLDFTKYGDKKIQLKAMVKNLDEENPTLVRVIFWIYEMLTEEMMGSVEMPWRWLEPGQERLFQTDFSSLDYWPYGLPMAEFDIGMTVYYMDYYISPGQPHWATVEDTPELPIMLGAKESPPVPVFAYYKEEGLTYTLDATGSYDADEKWGDYIDHGITRWVIVDPAVGVIGLYYGATKTFTFDHAGTYLIQMRVHDSFGVRVYYADGAYFPIEVTE